MNPSEREAQFTEIRALADIVEFQGRNLAEQAAYLDEQAKRWGSWYDECHEPADIYACRLVLDELHKRLTRMMRLTAKALRAAHQARELSFAAADINNKVEPLV